MSKARFAGVAVEGTAYSFDTLFTYLVPDELSDRAVPGVRVTVPFGRGGRERVGMLFKLAQAAGEGVEPKEISAVLDREPVLSDKMLQMALWMKERYFCTLFEAVKVMLPAGFHLKLKNSYVLSPDFKDFDREAYSPTQWQIITCLKSAGKSVAAQALSGRLGIAEGSPELSELMKRDIVRRVNTAASRVGDATAKMLRPTPDYSGRLSPRQQEVYKVLCDVGEASEKEICYFTGVSQSVIKTMAKNGALEIFEYELYRRPDYSADGANIDDIALSPSQETAFRSILSEYRERKLRCSLLYGVTGSGKTLVFMKLIKAVREEGKGVIVMVPEISLTPQTIGRFKAGFGDEIAVFHSRLSLGERLDEWKRVKRGKASIVVGTRSAVFAPVKDLGLIVIDEEQEHSYKSESSPRYDAREVARFRSWKENTFCLLSSATPSVESFKLAQDGKYGFNCLDSRFGEARMPEVKLADGNFDSIPGDSFSIGDTLAEALVKNFEARRQSIILLNRRGYHTFARCSFCGEVMTCPNCSISLTYHSANNRLMCHYCGYSAPFSKACPSCGSSSVSFRGLGTQKAEEQLRKLLPEARILRLDTDSVAAKYSLEKRLEEFARGEYDVMVGTQMVAKGLDFENVTLVGVLSADQLLYGDDFRSSEKTFDLLTQVVGRAGRGKYPGTAIIQTCSPENPVLRFAAGQDYLGFYEQEIMFRKVMLYPPFVDLLVIGFVGTREKDVSGASRCFLKELEALAKNEYSGLPMRVLRPTPAAVAKVAGKYRYKLIIKCRSSSGLREMLSRLLAAFSKKREFASVTAYADLNPYNIL